MTAADADRLGDEPVVDSDRTFGPRTRSSSRCTTCLLVAGDPGPTDLPTFVECERARDLLATLPSTAPR